MHFVLNVTESILVHHCDVKLILHRLGFGAAKKHAVWKECHISKGASVEHINNVEDSGNDIILSVFLST